MKEHHYKIKVEWIGNHGEGTKTYRSYGREHTISANGKPEISASSDPAFRGDATRYNPEDLLVASASACHMLSYLHLCAVNDVVVVGYQDAAMGTMQETERGSGKFIEVVLEPKVTISAESDAAKAMMLHDEAHHLCFIANSLNFPVRTEAEILVARAENS